MKIGIVGSGLVGSTAAYAMVMSGVGREIALIDQNTARAQAEADDQELVVHAGPQDGVVERVRQPHRKRVVFPHAPRQEWA